MSGGFCRVSETCLSCLVIPRTCSKRLFTFICRTAVILFCSKFPELPKGDSVDESIKQMIIASMTDGTNANCAKTVAMENEERLQVERRKSPCNQRVQRSVIHMA